MSGCKESRAGGVTGVSALLDVRRQDWSPRAKSESRGQSRFRNKAETCTCDHLETPNSFRNTAADRPFVGRSASADGNPAAFARPARAAGWYQRRVDGRAAHGGEEQHWPCVQSADGATVIQESRSSPIARNGIDRESMHDACAECGFPDWETRVVRLAIARTGWLARPEPRRRRRTLPPLRRSILGVVLLLLSSVHAFTSARANAGTEASSHFRRRSKAWACGQRQTGRRQRLPNFHTVCD